ncbi:hypothetical protein JW796_03370 [Candidatus Dojkabacteria bacterium]|nr:hypothetical protein [Candidatus Dojkabacteria bacterium]
MPDIQENIENEQAGLFDPSFAYEDLRLLEYFSTPQQVLSDEEADKYIDLINTVFQPDLEVNRSHALGYKVMLGMVGVGGDFAAGLEEISAEEDRLQYVIMMSRRDKYVNYVSPLYTKGYSALATNDPSRIKDYSKWNFNNQQEAYEYFSKYIEYANSNVDFIKFLGYILYFLERRESIETGIDDNSTEGLIQITSENDYLHKSARIGIFNFFIFNQMYPLDDDKRKTVLESLGIPAEKVPILNLMDDDLVKTLWEEDAKSIEWAQIIAGCFTYFDARSWYNEIP